MDTPQIALIGTEGSGKTVLTTVLAKRFSIATPDGFFLNPLGTKTMLYVENVWNELQNGRWMPSTSAGQMFELKWSLQYKGKSFPMRLIDTAGQDLRRLYSDEGYKDIDNLSEQDKKFVEYVHNSTILIVLVNLGDFISVADTKKKTYNQAVLKGFLDSVQDERQKIAVIFTQYDQYGPVIGQQYGDLEKFLQKELSYLYGGHIHGKNIALFPVAAVSQTEIRTSADGKAGRFPKRGFTSDGLDMLADWIGNAVVEIAVEKQKQQAKKATAGRQRQRSTRPYPILIQNDETEWSWRYDCLGILCPATGDHTITASIPVRNDGAAGYVRVICEVGGTKGYDTVYFNEGEAKWVEVRVKPDSHNYKEASCSLKVF